MASFAHDQRSGKDADADGKNVPRKDSLSMNAHDPPYNNLVQPLLTDFYQISMAHAYWKSGRHALPAVFDVFFRKNPFHGEYTVFAGLDEVLRYVKNYGFTDSDIAYLRKRMPYAEAGFFEYLESVDTSEVVIHSMFEGSVCFPRVPVIRLHGPLLICQLLETTILNLTNYASLMATNASRFRMAAGRDKTLLEFGLRRAQGTVFPSVFIHRAARTNVTLALYCRFWSRS